MCKKDRENIIKQNEQKQKYKSNQKQFRKNINDEQKQKIKDYQKQYRENMTDEQKQKYKNNQK